MKVYVMRRENEPLRENEIVAVGRKADAERLINNSFFDYYEVVEVLSGIAIDEFFKTQIGRG